MLAHWICLNNSGCWFIVQSGMLESWVSGPVMTLYSLTAPFLSVSLLCECCFNNEAGCGPPRRCIHTFSYSPWITAGLTPVLVSSHQDADCWLMLLQLLLCEVRWIVWISDFICRFFFLIADFHRSSILLAISLAAVGSSCCFYLCPEHYLHSI